MSVIKSVLIHDQIYDIIRRAMMAGFFRTGDQLSTRSLAKDFNISQMPVRDALNRLASERALERTPDRRFRVPELSENELQDLWFARTINEGAAAELAATNITSAQLDKLISTHEEIESQTYGGNRSSEGALDILVDMDLHNRFHFTLYNACNNPVLISLIENLWLQYAPGIARYLEVQAHTLSEKSSQELKLQFHKKHRKIVAALKAKSPERTKAALVADITSYKEIYKAYNTEIDRQVVERHITDFIQ